MKSFWGGFIVGAAGVATWALTHQRSQAEREAADGALHQAEHDATHLVHAIDSVRKRTSALQQIIQSTVPEAESGINDALDTFKFQTEPRIQKITQSMQHINNVLPEKE